MSALTKVDWLLEAAIHRAFYKWAAVSLLALSVALATYRILADPLSWPRRSWTSYVTYLERKLRDMFVQTSGSLIATLQLVLIAATIGMRLFSGMAYLEWLVVVISAGPAIYIENMRRNRIKVIEKQVEPFILTLASTLKTTPSIGNALASVHPLLIPPLQDEIGLVLKEMRVGNTIEQSLLNLGGRIPIVELDATLASILVGRQVGGNLPEILDSTASTLREMERLAGTLRTKTASAKIQVFVLSAIPPFVIVALDVFTPHYLDPLTSSALGLVLVTVACVLWFMSVIMARKIMQVDL